ncbi:MAG: hypothetical protein H7A55_04030 [Verrucomicrobiaceae bacterium]|nr:hypothetical protein [Verrucomicrobiaceae bacterium]
MKLYYLPLVCLAFGLTLSAQTEKPKGAKWDAAMAEFDELDKSTPPPASPIVFVGSSSIRKWTTLAADFPGLPVINRGFGGSQMSDLLQYFDRLVTTYKPAQLVVYEGDNDLGASKSPEQVLADFKTFCAKVRAVFPDVPVHFISTKPSPKRIAIIDKQRQFNAMLVEYLATQQKMDFIDVFSLMLDESGKPVQTLFVADNLHMTPAGYAIWTAAVSKALQ